MASEEIQMRAKGLSIIFLVALLLRWTAIEVAGARFESFGDSGDYLSAAQSLCSGRGFPDRGSLPFFRAPLLPLFVAAATGCSTGNVHRFQYVLALGDAMTVVIIGLLAFFFWRRNEAAFVAAAVAAIDPFFIAGLFGVRTEPLFMLLMTGALALLLAGTTRGSPWRLAVSGLLTGFAALTRPVALLLIPLGVVAAIVIRPAGRRRRALLSVLFIAGASLALGPWTLRNYRRYDELILVNDAGGYNIWRGSSRAMAAIWPIRNAAGYRRATESFERDVSAPAARAIESQGGGPRSREHRWVEKAMDEVARSPETFALYTLRKACDYWRPWLNPQEYGELAVLLSGGVITLSYILGMLGLAEVCREKKRVGRWLIVFLVALWLAQLPCQVVMRFRVPLSDPLLLALGAGPLTALLARRRGGGAAGERDRGI